MVLADCHGCSANDLRVYVTTPGMKSRILEKINLQPKSVNTVGQLCPRFMAAANSRTSSVVLQASTPRRARS
jgi:hypothetical protein